MQHVTPADLRALRASHRVRLYDLAAAAHIAPTTLLELLNERRPLDAERALRIAEAIHRLAPRTRP